MIPERYDRNWSAFKDILSLANKKGMQVLVYVPPIRRDVPIPTKYPTTKDSRFRFEMKLRGQVFHAWIWKMLFRQMLGEPK